MFKFRKRPRLLPSGLQEFVHFLPSQASFGALFGKGGICLSVVQPFFPEPGQVQGQAVVGVVEAVAC